MGNLICTFRISSDCKKEFNQFIKDYGIKYHWENDERFDINLYFIRKYDGRYGLTRSPESVDQLSRTGFYDEHEINLMRNYLNSLDKVRKVLGGIEYCTFDLDEENL